MPIDSINMDNAIEQQNPSKHDEALDLDSSQPREEEDRSKAPAENHKRRRALRMFAAVLVLAAIGGLLYWLHARHFEETDDAQIDGNLSPVGVRVNGTVTKVYVHNNQAVHVGDPLVELDPRDSEVSVDQADAQLAQARSRLSAARPNVPIIQVQNATNIIGSRAETTSAEAALAAAERDRDQAAAHVVRQEAATAKAQRDLQRYRLLVEKQEISRSDFDQYESDAQQQSASLQAVRSALLAAERNVDQRKAQLEQAKSRQSQTERIAHPQLLTRQAEVDQQEANVKTAAAQLEQAKLNLAYTKISAPVSGIVMKRSAQVGARVSAGQQLLTISEIGNLWVTANFKETQLLKMRPGQPAMIHVDALDKNFTGVVETIGGATGSVASVLPPENATGNYVKVVQRIPVRIKFDPHQDGLERLRPGMSVEPRVRVDRQRGVCGRSRVAIARP
jgi:membrane fusion protein (multidrug efflux system)